MFFLPDWIYQQYENFRERSIYLLKHTCFNTSLTFQLKYIKYENYILYRLNYWRYLAIFKLCGYHNMNTITETKDFTVEVLVWILE